MTVPLIELQTKRCRYEQLKEQEYFQKHDDAFYRNMVKILCNHASSLRNKYTIECIFPQVVK